MYRPPLRHVLPHMATGVDIGPRLRDSGDIGHIAAASAPVRLCPISMAVASPYFSSPLHMTDLSEGRAPPRKYDPEGHVWTPPPVQEESLDSCGAGSGAAMCPASAAAAH